MVRYCERRSLHSVKKYLHNYPFFNLPFSNRVFNILFRSNSHFAVGTKYGTKTELFDFSPIFGESPKGSFQLTSLCVLKVFLPQLSLLLLIISAFIYRGWN